MLNLEFNYLAVRPSDYFIFLYMQNLLRIIVDHAFGIALLKSKSLDADKKNLLVEILANDWIFQHDRYETSLQK